MPNIAMTTDRIGPAPHIAVQHVGVGALVLFLHGIGGSKENWYHQLPVLAHRFRAAAWDARGYGESDDYVGPCSFDDFADDVIRVCDFYQAPEAHLVGLSMGGRIAQNVYFRYPTRVASLTLVDTQLSFQQRSEADRAQFLAARQAPLLAGKTPRDIAPVVVKSLVGPDATHEAVQMCIESMSRLRTESYLKTLTATVNQQVAGDLATIRVPCHVIVGEFDTLTPPSLSASMAAKIPDAQLTVIPGAGHLSNMESPEVFNRAMAAFLDRIDAGR